MQHIIKKQIIDLSVDKGLDAFHIQQKVNDTYFAKILPLLQEAFDMASTEEEIISIDNLVIDLGIITEKEIEKGNWEEKVFKIITEQLIPVKQGISSAGKAKKKSSSLTISEQWMFYMQHGYLPWNVLQLNKAWYDKVLEAFACDAVAISNLRHLINSYPNLIRRIVFQNSILFLKSLIETLTAENQDTLPKLINELSKIQENKTQIFSLEEKKGKLWEQALKLAASKETKLTPAKIVALLISNNYIDNKQNLKRIQDFALKNKIDFSLVTKNHQEAGQPTEEKSTKNSIEKESKIDIDEEGLYVSNAGVVLLHPFLNLFFKNLHFLYEEHFVDTKAQLKAVNLLHYLVTGNTKPVEHELVIPKVLCSWPLEEPVNNFTEFTHEELQEADDLLRSAIQQWSILKGTSVAGFRESFLQRKGKLFTKNDNLVLQIERGSIDMLLDHLPWNLSIIKLPWMNNFLKVEWR